MHCDTLPGFIGKEPSTEQVGIKDCIKKGARERDEKGPKRTKKNEKHKRKGLVKNTRKCQCQIGHSLVARQLEKYKPKTEILQPSLVDRGRSSFHMPK